MMRTMPMSVHPRSMQVRRPRRSDSHIARARENMYEMKFPPARRAGSLPVKPPRANISGA